MTKTLQPVPIKSCRHRRGFASTLGILTVPLGTWWRRGIADLSTPERLDHGLVIVLPGIEGKSHLSLDIAHGLADGGVPLAVEVIDWTTGFPLLFAVHLRARNRNRRIAKQIADRITAYQEEYPARPVHIIGHSGGAGVALFALENMSTGRSITSALLLAAAVSPAYALANALSRTESGIWNFYSPMDVLFLGIGTLVLGTIDSRHTISAGTRGFKIPPNSDAQTKTLYETRLHQQPYNRQMAASWHLGGHNGWTNCLFTAEWLAPMLS
jgi:hypothetical protein